MEFRRVRFRSDGNDLHDIGVMCPPHNQVERLTELARSAGLDGIVCSGHEVSAERQLWPDGYFVVPGVRPPDGKKGDQKSSVTPRQALAHGESILVVGTPLNQEENTNLAAPAN